MTSKKIDMKLSNLVKNTLSGLSPIQTIMKMAEDRNIIQMGLKPSDVISFGGGWCNHYAPEELVDSYKEILNDKELFHKSGRYSAIIGDYECRKHLTEFEKKIFKIKALNPENILLGQSSTHLFHDMLRVLGNPGDNICFLDPTYANYFNAVKCALKGSKTVFISALEKNTWDYLPEPDKSLEELKKQCTNGTKILVIPVPDNPTSQIQKYDFLKSCLEIMDDYDGFLVLDYAYKALWFGDMPKCFSWSPNNYDNLICIHSNSKWLSSLGRRFGWVEADETIIKGFEKLNESTLLSPDTLHSMATMHFLKKTLNNNILGDFIEKTRNLYEETAKVMTDAIEEYLGWKYLKPMGGLYTVCPTPKLEDPNKFVERILKNTGVLLIPGKGFGPSMEKGVRLSYGPLCYNHDKIREGIKKVGEYLG